MNVLQAHELFSCAKPPRGFPLPRFPGIPSAILWPVCATGAVVLTGQIAVCDCAADLDRAFAGFVGLLRVDAVDTQAWADACLQVLAEYIDAGQRLESRMAAIALSN
ncbi:MAG: hypothetical protein AB7O62_08565 [Pirellulales bacterium]